MPKALQRKNRGCEKCYEKGYVVEKKATFSTAEICECIKKCKECGGSGSVLATNDRGYTYIDICKYCGVVRRNVKLYNLAGIPAKYSYVLVDSFQPGNNKFLQNALKYVKDEFIKKYPNRRGFLLMGGTGLGKTHLAVGAVSELTLEHGIKCIFKDFCNLLTELKEAYTQGNSENAVLRPLIETEVLAIDELGKGKNNEWELNILDQLISKRYNASKVTLITTNYVSKEYAKKDDHDILEARVGERIASRLHGMCEFIYLDGEDYRVKKKV